MTSAFLLFSLVAVVSLLTFVRASVNSGRCATPARLTWFHAAAVLLTASFVLYCWGVLKMATLDGTEHDYCVWKRAAGSHQAVDGAEFSYRQESLFPLSATCHWNDGYTLYVVPSSLNRTIALLTAASGLALVLAMVTRQPGSSSETRVGPDRVL